MGGDPEDHGAPAGDLSEVRQANGEGSQCRDIVVGEPADEADRGGHTGFARHEGLAGGPGQLILVVSPGAESW